MPSLISSTERANLTGNFNDIFDTFKRSIVIYREPIKVPRVTTEEPLFGYGDSQTEQQYDYIPQSGVFDATIRYPSRQPVEVMSDPRTSLSEGQVSIKVKRECRDYIKEGKVDKIVVDERSFILNDDERKSTFLDSEFFIFILKTTN